MNRELIERAVKNSGILFVGEAISRAFVVVSFFIITRYLAAERFGQYSFIFAYLSFFCLLSDFGLDSIAIREMAQKRQQPEVLLGNIILLRLLLTLLAIGLSVLLIQPFAYSSDIKRLIYYGSLTILFSYRYNSFRSIFEVPFQLELTMFYPVCLKILSELIFLSGIGLVIWMDSGLKGVILVRILAPLPSSLLLIWLSVRLLRPRFRVEPDLCLKVLGYTLPLALTLFVGLILGRIDILILSQLTDDRQVGFYSAAMRLVEILTILPTTLMITVYPLLARYQAEDRQRMRELYETTFKYLFSIILPLCPIVFFYRLDIVYLVFGEGYGPSARVLPLLIGAMVFIFYNIVYNYLLIAMDLQRYYLYAICMAASINIALNLLFIPYMGFSGAGLAALLSQMSIFIYGLSNPQTREYACRAAKSALIPLVASLVLIPYLLVLPHDLLLLILLFPGLYVFFLYFLGGIGPKEILLLKNLVTQLRSR